MLEGLKNFAKPMAPKKHVYPNFPKFLRKIYKVIGKFLDFGRES